MSEWTLYARTPAGARGAQIDEFITSKLIPRYCDVGTWALDIPADSPAAPILITPGAGVEFVRDGVTILSGPRTHRERIFNENDDLLRLAGCEDTVHLARRICHPVPATGNFATSAYDTRTGITSTIMGQFVDVNAGPSALARRRVSGLTIGADPGVGLSATWHGRLQPLLLLLRIMNYYSGVGFRIRDLVFETFLPQDKSGSVKFSTELGNLAAFSYVDDAPTVDYVYVGGGGEGTARTFVERQDSTAVAEWGLIEQFSDRRDTTDTTELANAGDSELTQGASRSGVSIKPIDTPGRSYGVDYQVGDTVTAIIDGTAIVDVVTEVEIDLGANGETIIPALGSVDVLKPIALFARLRELETRTLNLERR